MKNTPENPSENPFFDIPQFPDFSGMTPEAARSALPVLLAKAEEEVTRLESDARPTWDGFMEPLDAAERPLFEAWGLVGHLASVCNCEAWRSVLSDFQADIVAFSLRCAQSKRFLELYRTVESVETDPVRRRIAGKEARNMELAGVGLEDAQRGRFNEICARLAQLATDFRDCVLDATKAWTLPVAEADLEGLPANDKAALRAPDGSYALAINDAAYVPLMKHLTRRDLRERLYRARCGRAPENLPRLREILALKRELAGLLGFASAAELSLETKCAPSVAAVMAMIDALAEAALKVAPDEDAELAAMSPDGAPQPWDRAYLAERLRERKYSYSESELSEYLDFPDVLRGLFGLARRLFGVAVEERVPPAGVWHDDVRFFAVKDGTDTEIAYFYLDPYVRPESKSGGAWMNDFKSLRPGVKPVAVMCCNFPKPDADGRCLLRFSDVETVFHEFGHALQHMLTTVREPAAAGINLIEWDAVEVASQFMENWCYDERTMRDLALHCVDRTPIPSDLLARVRAAKNFRAANFTLRQLAFARIDMVLHGEAECEPNAVKEQVFRAYGQQFVEGDRFLESFSHIFAGGYSAGYYSYKWSEVMSADCFGAFEDAGLDDEEAVRETGRRYRDTVLALGGSRDPMEVFALFRGRAPTIAALLRQQGLDGICH